MTITTIGIDLAKNTFQVHGADSAGRTVLRKKLRRSQFLEFFANLPTCMIGMEACGGAHYWARELSRFGHTVRLMPPQYVKPYVKRNKHDAADAEACCEAVQRPGMKFVPIKSEGQQSLLMLHRIRDRLLAERTASINAIRGHMAEFGIVAAQRVRGFNELRAVIGDSDDRRLPVRARALLACEVEHLQELEDRIQQLDRELLEQARTDETCRRLSEVPGVGPVIATAMVATVCDAKLFRNGRSFAAWIGLTPIQHSSGGKEWLLGISRRGDGYLRRQLMNGARALVRVAKGREGNLRRDGTTGQTGIGGACQTQRAASSQC
jgi:transposase